ncbi:MFS transporter [Actinoplanes sp. NPDC051470]|uniref:MFS transporter n=1 Tax=Actinoplanes sp. NPDC051470 TaxID=3157224 RepID=UPI003444F116
MRYVELLRLPGAAAFFAAASIGRVGIASSGLAVVLAVRYGTGSYATAGVVAGCFAAAEAVAGPQTARLIDRHGQTRVLPALLLAHATAVAFLVAPGGPRWMAGLLLGATVPQLGALSGARWVALLEPPDRAVAFALESQANAVAFLVGPVMVSAVAAAGRPVLCPVLAGGLIVAGGLWLAAQRKTAPAGMRGGPGRSALLSRAFLAMAGVNAALGVFFGAVPVAVTAFTAERHIEYAAAALFAVSSGAGLLGGWLYGRWPRGRLTTAAVALCAGSVPLVLAGGPLLLAAGLVLTGAVIPVILVLGNVLVVRIVDRAALTQAYTWLNTAAATGSAAAVSAAGWAIDRGGSHDGLLIAAGATVVVALIVGFGG